MDPRTAKILDFWLGAGPKAWFARNDAFDAEIRETFEADHFAAARGEFDDWAEAADGALALLLLLDQVPRNLWRGTAHAFATDALARRVARGAVARGHDRAAAQELRPFFYLPFEHSEDLADQARGVTLCEAMEPSGAAVSRPAGRHPGQRRASAATAPAPARSACSAARCASTWPRASRC